MQGILLQQSTGDCEQLTKVSEPWHSVYATRHDWVYQLSHRIADVSRHAVWDKIAALVHAMRTWTFVPKLVLLDADAVIRKQQQDTCIGDALPDGYDIGVLRRDFTNSGFLIVRNTVPVVEFLEHVFHLGPLHTANPKIDARLHEELAKTKLKVKELSSKWNWFEIYGNGPRHTDCEEQDAVVRAWHGQPRETVLREMKRCLA